MRVIKGGETISSDPAFFSRVREESGEPVELCYHCQKCASGCPMAEYTDYTPNQVLRMVLFGLKDRALESSVIWLCSSCETCAVRCPNGIRIPEVMDVLRHMSAREGRAGEKQTETFHRMFLNEVKSRGRVNEGMLLAKYKLRTGQLFSDLDLGFKLFTKGKMPLVPRSIKNKQQVRKIFERVMSDREGGK